MMDRRSLSCSFFHAPQIHEDMLADELATQRALEWHWHGTGDHSCVSPQQPMICPPEYRLFGALA
jgi:hypothetical protein